MFIKSFWKSITCAIIILLLSCTPGSNFKKISLLEIIYADKIIHLLMYFVLTIYLKYGFNKYMLKKIYLPLIISMGYGGILEFIQNFFIPERTGDIVDFIFNSIGALFAFLLYEKLERKKLIL